MHERTHAEHPLRFAYGSVEYGGETRDVDILDCRSNPSTTQASEPSKESVRIPPVNATPKKNEMTALGLMLTSDRNRSWPWMDRHDILV
jgi:hypothetical protein